MSESTLLSSPDAIPEVSLDGFSWLLTSSGLRSLSPETSSKFIPIVDGNECPPLGCESTSEDGVLITTAEGYTVTVPSSHEIRITRPSKGVQWQLASELDFEDTLVLSSQSTFDWDSESPEVEKEFSYGDDDVFSSDSSPVYSSAYIVNYLRSLLDQYGTVDSCVSATDPRLISLSVAVSDQGLQRVGGAAVLQQLLLSLGVVTHQEAVGSGTDVVIYGSMLRNFNVRIGFSDVGKKDRLSRFMTVLPSTALADKLLSQVAFIEEGVTKNRVSGPAGSQYTLNGIVLRIPE